MKPGTKCPDCGALAQRQMGWSTRYVCPNGCDTRRVNQKRSEEATKRWDRYREEKARNANV